MRPSLPRCRSIAALLALLLAFATPLTAGAGADALDDAKAAGQVGERSDGSLGVVNPSAPTPVHELVARINRGRAKHYAAIAEKTGTSAAKVAALAGQKLIARTPTGQYYMDASGSWVQR